MEASVLASMSSFSQRRTVMSWAGDLMTRSRPEACLRVVEMKLLLFAKFVGMCNVTKCTRAQGHARRDNTLRVNYRETW